MKNCRIGDYVFITPKRLSQLQGVIIEQGKDEKHWIVAITGSDWHKEVHQCHLELVCNVLDPIQVDETIPHEEVWKKLGV